MSATTTPREYAFWPLPSVPHAVGLLFCEVQPEGYRITVAVEPDYLRMFVAGVEAGADLSGLDMSAAPVIPHALPDWPDEWPAGSPFPAVLDAMHSLLADGHSWREIVEWAGGGGAP